MNETQISFQGNVGGNVQVRQAGESRVATFRVAATPRRYQRSTDAWVDGDTQWYTVNAWRALGEHCEQSLRRGDPVFVQGRLRATTWTNSAGIEVTGYEVDAAVVGHDLSRGTAVFTRTPRPEGAPATEPADPGRGAESTEDAEGGRVAPETACRGVVGAHPAAAGRGSSP